MGPLAALPGGQGTVTWLSLSDTTPKPEGGAGMKGMASKASSHRKRLSGPVGFLA